MVKIIRAEELPSEEVVYLRKDFFGWRVVDPIVDPQTKKFLWKNFFNLKGFVVLGLLLLFLGIGYLAFHEQVNNYYEIMHNACKYCSTSSEFVGEINLTSFAFHIK